MESETRTHNRARLRHQSAHSNRQLSPIQVQHAPADPPADRKPRAKPIVTITYRHPPATRRRRIRQRASTNLRGRAASRSALVQPPSRPVRSRCEPTVHSPSPLPVHPHHSPIRATSRSANGKTQRSVGGVPSSVARVRHPCAKTFVRSAASTLCQSEGGLLRCAASTWQHPRRM